MLSFAYLFLAMQSGPAIEHLPIDEIMARFEEAIPELSQFEANLAAELGKLGSVESDWSISGLSMSSAIQAEGKSTSDFALGEWEQGGRSVITRGDRPLAVRDEFSRYIVREYSGPISYNYYHRITGVPSQIVIHSFGSVRQIGNSECQNSEGLELISSDDWRSWTTETMLIVFSMVRATRDDTNEYCNLFRPDQKGGYQEVSYTAAGRPYVTDNSTAQKFVVTALGEASKRLFEKEINIESQD